MQISPTVLAILATALVLIAANYVKTMLAQAGARRAAALKAETDLVQALQAFTTTAGKLSGGFEKIEELPKFMEGFVKVCQAFVIEVSKMRAASDKLNKLILQGQDGREAIQTPTEDDKDRAYRVMEHMASGMDAEAAAQAVADEELKKTTYGVTDLG